MMCMYAARSLLDAVHSTGAVHSEVDALQGVVYARLGSVQLPYFLRARNMRSAVLAPRDDPEERLLVRA